MDQSAGTKSSRYLVAFALLVGFAAGFVAALHLGGPSGEDSPAESSPGPSFAETDVPGLDTRPPPLSVESPQDLSRYVGAEVVLLDVARRARTALRQCEVQAEEIETSIRTFLVLHPVLAGRGLEVDSQSADLRYVADDALRAGFDARMACRDLRAQMDAAGNLGASVDLYLTGLPKLVAALAGSAASIEKASQKALSLLTELSSRHLTNEGGGAMYRHLATVSLREALGLQEALRRSQSSLQDVTRLHSMAHDNPMVSVVKSHGAYLLRNPLVLPSRP